ncbi:hypothetical protein PIB30_058857 [Stylosanthes scabra]|uniref:Reverse transcriptase domain-containing protein n=1 Tax=Stylosanthes scabra TaxID=79078 RepID=A0ABU6QJI6_9FABA|nr:hypothetical protein [Stylosanthes scabra]
MLKSRWEGPYKVKNIFPYGMVELEQEPGKPTFKVNGHIVKRYHEQYNNKEQIAPMQSHALIAWPYEPQVPQNGASVQGVHPDDPTARPRGHEIPSWMLSVRAIARLVRPRGTPMRAHGGTSCSRPKLSFQACVRTLQLVRPHRAQN